MEQEMTQEQIQSLKQCAPNVIASQCIDLAADLLTESERRAAKKAAKYVLEVASSLLDASNEAGLYLPRVLTILEAALVAAAAGHATYRTACAKTMGYEKGDWLSKSGIEVIAPDEDDEDEDDDDVFFRQ